MKNVKENKIVRMARLAQELGYTHIATVVKSVFSTTYHNVNSCESIIETGKWAGAWRSHQFNGQRMGTNGSEIDWGKTISRTSISYKLEQLEK